MVRPSMSVLLRGVGQNDAARHARHERGPDLSQRDLRLGPELHVVGDVSLRAPRRVVGPFLGQIQPIRDPRVKPGDQTGLYD